MSREVSDMPVGTASGGGNRLVSEPAFELLFSEIIAYTGAFVAKSAASHATDVLRSNNPGNLEEVDSGGENEIEGDDGLVLEPSPASVGAGNAMFPVRTFEISRFRDNHSQVALCQHNHGPALCWR